MVPTNWNLVLIPLNNFFFAYYRKCDIKMCLLYALQNPDSNDHMAYWLSNASTLLFLLQCSLKASGAAGSSQRKPPQPTSFFGRMTQVITYIRTHIFVIQFVHEYGECLVSLCFVHEYDECLVNLCQTLIYFSMSCNVSQGFRSSSASLSVDVVRQVEAKYPALLFKQQLTAYVETFYGIIRDNLKKDLSPHLSSCIQVK